MASKQVAVVTGANKGIGFQIVRGLLKTLGENWDVILCSRDLPRGEAAVQEISREGRAPVLHQLDIEDQSSIDRLKEDVVKSYGKCSILVNNAGFAYKSASTVPFDKQAEDTVRINFFGTRAMMLAFIPVMAENGRIINVSSTAGLLSILSPDLQKAFSDENLTTDQGLVGLMNKFVQDVKEGQHQARGWPNTAYGTSKVGETALTKVCAREMKKQGKHILINAMCPGWCRTDMAGDRAPRTAEEGADTAIFLATDPSLTASGEFFADRAIRSC